MSRRVRLLGKKRGDRRTGSRRMGSYGEAAFFGALLVVGAIGMYWLVAELVAPEWRAQRRLVETQCTVLGVRVGAAEDKGTTLYRPEIEIEYFVDGRRFHAPAAYDITNVYSLSQSEARTIVNEFTVGKQYWCWYDPAEPATVVLVRGYTWWIWLLMIVPTTFIVLGAVGGVMAMLSSGTSTERRAAIAHRASHLDLFDEAGPRDKEYPRIPEAAYATSSPGTKLAFRLPVDASPGFDVAGVLLICILWNGIVLAFAAPIIAGHFSGQSDWWMTLLLVPFAVAGGALAWFTVQRTLRNAGAGATRIEISGYPLIPGESYELFLSQTGRLPFNSLEVVLICDEQATYRQGTNARTEQRPVYQHRLYRKHHPRSDPGLPFDDTFELNVPRGAMHSFHAAFNEVRWQLVVRGAISRQRDYERRFPIVIYPPHSSTQGRRSPRDGNAE